MTVEQELERYRADARYFEAHRQDLLARYPDHWVAIYHSRVVATARRLPALLEKLDRQRLPRSEVFIEHLAAQDDVLILPVR